MIWLAALERADGSDPPTLADLYGIAVPLPAFAFCEGGLRQRRCRRRVTRALVSLFGAPGVWGWSCGVHGRSPNWAKV